MRSVWRMAALVALVGCGEPVDEQQLADIEALTGDAVAGDALYADLCERCHGPGGDGEGVDRGPALIDRPLDATEVIETMLRGPQNMPSFATEPDQDLADVTAYVLSLSAR